MAESMDAFNKAQESTCLAADTSLGTNSASTSTIKHATADYEEQKKTWPSAGRHILGSWDKESIVVYQAFNDAIADYAVEHQTFGGPKFSTERMTWIKPNVCTAPDDIRMMYRS